MTEKLTWAEFVEKYKLKEDDKFSDDRGQEWVYSKILNAFFHGPAAVSCLDGCAGLFLTCPLIPPKKKRKMWPAIIRLKSGGLLAVGGILHESLESAKRFEDDQFHSWPAIPGPDGSYEVSE